MSACAWPEEVAPPPYDPAVISFMDDARFLSAFCPVCRAQVIGEDAVGVSNDLIAHVLAAHS